MYCNVGYYLDFDTNTCNKCSEHCLYCDSAEICFFCEFAYNLKFDDKCTPEVENFIIGYTNIATTNQALLLFDLNFKTFINEEICSNGYSKINNVCQKCSNGCLECISTTICVKCDANFKLGDNRLCTLIEPIILKPDKSTENINDCSLCFQRKFEKSPGCST
jgi:hypothetical protein